MRKTRFLLTLLFVFSFASGITAQDSGADLPAFADLEPGVAHVLAPGGDTLCSRGTPYHFQVLPAAAESNNLQIHFQGGGACWNDGMCGDGEDQTFLDAASDTPVEIDTGMWDRANPDNPLADYHRVFVSYCTGDVHVGNQLVTYGEGDAAFDIAHYGAINAEAVLDWVYANFDAPERIAVTGSSAGAYGAIHFAPRIMAQYPETPVVMLGDAGVGVTPVGWEVLGQWGLFDTLPEGYEDAFDPATFTINELYLTYGADFPQNTFAQFTTSGDTVQIGFSFLMGTIRWENQMYGLLGELDAELDNFASYVIGGDLHTILSQPQFYTYAVDGVPFYAWLDALLNGEVETIQCEVCEDPEMEATADE